MLRIKNNPSTILYRIGRFFYIRKFILISVLIDWLNRFLFSVWIPSSCSIGKNVTLGYWGLGVVIHKNAKIGNNCLIAQNVTIGRNLHDEKVPIIGDDVYIGVGSVVFGEIEIGDNVIIGANSVVNRSIPSNTIVAGNPFKVIKENTVAKYYD